MFLSLELQRKVGLGPTTAVRMKYITLATNTARVENHDIPLSAIRIIPDERTLRVVKKVTVTARPARDDEFEGIRTPSSQPGKDFEGDFFDYFCFRCSDLSTVSVDTVSLELTNLIERHPELKVIKGAEVSVLVGSSTMFTFTF